MTATSTGPSLGPTTPYYGGRQVPNPANIIYVTGTLSIHAIHNALGTIAVENSAAMAWMLTSLSGGTATWSLIASGAGAVESVLGTAGQITVVTAANTATVSLPAAVTAPGSLATTTTLASGTSLTAGTTFTATGGLSTLAALTQAGAASINATGAATTIIGTGGTGAVQIGNATGFTAITGQENLSGNLNFVTTGNKILSANVATTIAAGANSFGTVALSGGATTVVSTSAVHTGSMVFLQTMALGTVVVASTLAVSAISTGVSFTITPSVTTDTSTVAWFIVN